ncbi:hypothetical protein HQO38_16490 [Rhodococcus fascians]|jgi:hypothetical protein|uniref:Unannotated protein n=1 Tax=freshwater metagenome TaxID=449393 RepID=A0A6J7GGK4_9ZZZZ|nr:DUF2231 domain-containing protein [Rhodococcus fascians]MSX07325.1 hypothetical protein [Actinomycetota bacterium]MBM7242718.1 hypothetical protein [Rhodococcus fascians]MBY3809186.1 hypothetical protein [Rhodococcus fascians]MBY3840866.1 hypothetical protein [Rhodococcus fascians]MBY3846357.1 hypothetical protein [Rhodococcus fascians]
MSTFNGLPAHILLVHFIVVLAPLTALLAIAASIWTGVRSRLVWLIAALAVFTLVLTPLTTEAGEWLEKRVPETAAVEQHTEIGDWMIYFSVGLVIVAALLVFLHLRERRGNAPVRWQSIVVVVLAVVIGATTIVQVYRIGESGARAAWDDVSATAVDE